MAEGEGRKRRRTLGDYVRDYATNWRESTDPLPTKLAKTARNRTIAVFTLGGCCGHRGEPGC
jgi:hypothetical protein